MGIVNRVYGDLRFTGYDFFDCRTKKGSDLAILHYNIDIPVAIIIMVASCSFQCHVTYSVQTIESFHDYHFCRVALPGSNLMEFTSWSRLFRNLLCLEKPCSIVIHR
jgi:hypothetical protein